MSTPAAEAFRKTRQQYVAPTALPLTGQQTLTANDRCDSGDCGAQAWVTTEMFSWSAPLLWCAHHYEEHERAGHFSEATHAILDERPHLRAAVKAQAGAE